MVFVLAVLARLAAQVVLGGYAHPTTWEYEEIANHLLAGHGYTYNARGITYVASESSPLYVVLTASVYLVTGHSQAVMLGLQAAFGGLTAALAALVAGRGFAPAAGLAAGCLVAVDQVGWKSEAFVPRLRSSPRGQPPPLHPLHQACAGTSTTPA